MTPYAANLPRRYPGLKPFDRTQSAVFYGRREDAVRLTNMIMQQRLVVLFAKSGIGKTSILQAGVAPSLEQQNFAPVFLRLDKTDGQLADTVGEVLEKYPSRNGHDNTGEDPGRPQTLWERMKRLEFDLDGLPATPVLVLDQFEEVFTLGHNDQSRRRFLTELADLANESMPEAIRADLLKRFQDGDTVMTPDIMHWWERQPDLRIVISIRSDFLHLLDEISPLIPGILRNRYQLQPLNRKQAEEAIVLPAAAKSDIFASKPFRFRPEAMNQIINFLAGRENEETQQAVDDFSFLKRQDEIESFNLQILCQYVEEKIIAESEPEGFEVTPDFYGSQSGLEHEIRDFYQKQLQTLPEAFARKTGRTLENPEKAVGTVQRLIEESLVTPNDRRCSMVDDYLIASYPGIDQEFLDVLVDSRLLRKENRLGDFYYEISHDTLLPAVIESRNKRRNEEKALREKADYDSRLAEEAKRREEMEEQLATAKKQRRMARKVAITSFISLLVSIGFGIWFVKDYISASRDQLNISQKSVYSELYGAAIPGYEELKHHPRRCWVLSHTRPYVDIDSELVIARHFQAIFLKVDSSLQKGDSYFFRDDYATALQRYYESIELQNSYKDLNTRLSTQTASGLTDWRVDTARIHTRFRTLDYRLSNALKALIKEFKIRQRDFEVFNEAKVWGQAMRNLERMHQLLPAQPEDLDKLKHALNLDEDPREYVEKELEKCSVEIKKLESR